MIPLTVFDGYLYPGTSIFTTGGQIWLSANRTTWEKVAGNGFGTTNSTRVYSLITLGDTLYCATPNNTTSMQVWRTTDGIDWTQANTDGFGDSGNNGPYCNNSVAVFDDQWYVGTMNHATGGEIWKLLDTQVCVPVLMKKF